MTTSRRTKPKPSRLLALEDRVAALERELASMRPAPKPPAAPPKRSGPRCPGCSLPVERSRGTCTWCGFVFEAVRKKSRP